jgi:hypothetical protein
MRDHLAHRYFDTDHAIVQDVVDNDLAPTSSTRELSAPPAEPSTERRLRRWFGPLEHG